MAKACSSVSIPFSGDRRPWNIYVSSSLGLLSVAAGGNFILLCITCTFVASIAGVPLMNSLQASCDTKIMASSLL